nr:hypothetical protein [Nannocystis exedens]
MQGEDRLYQSGDPGGGLEVAGAGLERAEAAQRAVVARPAVHGLERLDLDRVAERRAGAVGLDVGDLLGGKAGAGEGVAQEGLLREDVGGGEAGGAAVLVDGAAAHEGPDPVAVAAGVGEALEDDDAAALAAHEAVGGGVEGAAAAARREGLGLREHVGGDGREDQVDAAGEGEVALAIAQAVAGEVDGGERRGAGGVDGDARALKAEQIGEPAGSEALAVAGERIDVEVGRLAGEDALLIVEGGEADEDAGAAAAQRRLRLTGVLERLPGDLEQEALLRVEDGGLARRDAKEAGVEAIDVIEKAGPPGGRRSLQRRIERPARLGQLAHEVDAPLQDAPELVRAVGAAREAAADPDDRQRLADVLLAGRQRSPQLGDLLERSF